MINKYDVIIIGGGLGGLTSGAFLAKAGKKVLLLEQHYLIGGCATCFERKGTSVDVGLHEMDFGPYKRDIKHVVFEKLRLNEKIELINLPSAWTIKTEKQSITIKHKTTENDLAKLFPNEKSGIKKYFKKLSFQLFLFRRLPQDMNFIDFFFAPLTTLIFQFINRFRNRKVGNVLDSIIQNDTLKRILNINLGYYHHNPYEFTWSFHAVAQGNYYNNAVYIKGGSQKLSDALVSIITEHGGEVQNRSLVTNILIEKNKAKGIKYKYKNERREVFSDVIIANCDPSIVYEDLLPKDFDATNDLRTMQNLKPSTSLVSLYMIFNKNISEIYKDLDYSTFILNDEELNAPFKDMNLLNEDINDRILTFVNYSKIDSNLSSNGNFLCAAVFMSTLKEWENLNDEEYKKQKEVYTQSILDRLDHVYPGITSHLIHTELATPRTIKHYIKTKHGQPYGYSQDFDMAFRPTRSKSIKNLYFASAFSFPGGGFTGAIISGYKTSLDILNPFFMFKRIGLAIIVGNIIGFGTSYLINNFTNY